MQDFLERNRFFSSLEPGDLVLDAACGTGSETAYFASQYPSLKFIGVDLESKFIVEANGRYRDTNNLRFETADLYNLNISGFGNVKAVLLSQTLSWLKWWEEELSSLVGPQVQQIALSTLAWDGPIESEVVHHLGGRGKPGAQRVNYNVDAIPILSEFMNNQGFHVQSNEKFIIDIDLFAPSHGGLGSHTIRSETNQRMIFSGWQHLPWHFFSFTRDAY